MRLVLKSLLEMYSFSVFKTETSGKPWRSVNGAAFPPKKPWPFTPRRDDVNSEGQIFPFFGLVPDFTVCPPIALKDS